MADHLEVTFDPAQAEFDRLLATAADLAPAIGCTPRVNPKKVTGSPWANVKMPV